MYEGLHHVALIIRDLEKAKQFYGEVLGFVVSQDRPDFDFDGIWYHIGTTELHLVVPRGNKAGAEQAAISPKEGHFAIRVTNMKELLERFDRYNWKYESYPDSITGWHQVFIADPEGHRIEFNEPL